MCLSVGEVLWLFEIPQVFVVSNYGYQVFGSGKVVSPFLEHLDDSKELPIINIVIYSAEENVAEW